MNNQPFNPTSAQGNGSNGRVPVSTHQVPILNSTKQPTLTQIALLNRRIEELIQRVIKVETVLFKKDAVVFKSISALYEMVETLVKNESTLQADLDSVKKHQVKIDLTQLKKDKNMGSESPVSASYPTTITKSQNDHKRISGDDEIETLDYIPPTLTEDELTDDMQDMPLSQIGRIKRRKKRSNIVESMNPKNLGIRHKPPIQRKNPFVRKITVQELGSGTESISESALRRHSKITEKNQAETSENHKQPINGTPNDGENTVEASTTPKPLTTEFPQTEDIDIISSGSDDASDNDRIQPSEKVNATSSSTGSVNENENSHTDLSNNRNSKRQLFYTEFPSPTPLQNSVNVSNSILLPSSEVGSAPSKNQERMLNSSTNFKESVVTSVSSKERESILSLKTTNTAREKVADPNEIPNTQILDTKAPKPNENHDNEARMYEEVAQEFWDYLRTEGFVNAEYPKLKSLLQEQFKNYITKNDQNSIILILQTLAEVINLYGRTDSSFTSTEVNMLLKNFETCSNKLKTLQQRNQNRTFTEIKQTPSKQISASQAKTDLEMTQDEILAKINEIGEMVYVQDIMWTKDEPIRAVTAKTYFRLRYYRALFGSDLTQNLEVDLPPEVVTEGRKIVTCFNNILMTKPFYKSLPFFFCDIIQKYCMVQSGLKINSACTAQWKKEKSAVLLVVFWRDITRSLRGVPKFTLLQALMELENYRIYSKKKPPPCISSLLR
ncbi:uncharacterized protein KNAG_0B04620 [Huiozyma naganishii CBS 8797]|uniref:Uncharacterized protein n=1 Tax=Huiozyma naganishii (strain ATCC MYA-139 / BCRC 22969 / CBS 8797 / KCTC 17520 / NBRC 10181 / NCYC 3082 / Yp74L-3) TaxID=1071383 RepID=J7S4Z4_HUIN7|nr:hypothetical protein KNAG_0B04620 [Kazachstania naganishii CBS 8797]CCK68896.1 hypothetical protein KNAG_0B04620 [Kazachstania naganishii CBS 8797]